MSAVEKSSGLSWTAGSSRHEMTPRPSGAVRSRSAIVELRLAEELVAAAVLERRRARAGARRRSRSTRPPMPSQLGLALVGVEEREQRAQVGEVEQRQPLRRRRSGRRARGSAPASRWRSSTLASSCGPKSETVARTGTPGPMPPSERNSTGKPVGANGIAELGRRASAPAPAGVAGRGEAGEVALDVGDEHRHAGGRELLGDPLQRLRLAGAGRARDQPVAVHHRQRRPARRRPARAAPSWTPRPRSIAGPSAA